MSHHMSPESLPFVVCPRCQGHGTHGNPAFDGMSWSIDTFDGNDRDMDDFADNYFSGNYDVRCEECGGQRVVKAECECEECENEREEIAIMEMERRSEMRMGC